MLGRAILTAAILVSMPLAASAQQSPTVAPGHGPVSVGLLGGLGAGTGQGGGIVGGTLAAVLSERLSIEGRGVHMDRGSGADALEVSASLVVDLLVARRAVPYVSFGGGMYRAGFDLDNRQFFGMMGGLGPGEQIVPTMRGWGMMGSGNTYAPGAGWMMGDFTWDGVTRTGPQFTGSHMPAFYANRLGAMTMPADGRWGSRTFTDPAVTFGGGIRFDVTEAISLRPDVRTIMVIADGDTYTLASFSVAIGYRF